MGVCTEKDNLAVVMEYVEGRDLGTIVHDPAVTIPTKQRLHIAKQVAQGNMIQRTHIISFAKRNLLFPRSNRSCIDTGLLTSTLSQG